ncbi:hypothetical protein [Chryseolinea soli]|uniref:Uncharacterized protein n=1 Tax=Chryseolinea soli TaxID=2321403 RepID=A0A385STL2_9BACT|nr:hypothetical protein [Chryseolinea soli]AYB32148.1 hypothetical protein D4L85_16915 [Chryseolinea soli]
MTADQIQEFGNVQRIEESLANAMGVPKLSSGWKTIRDDRGWRQDEKLIEYVWIVMMNRHSVGRGGLVTVRFNEHTFRGKKHPDELVRGIFSIGADNQIQEFYQEKTDGHADPVIDCFQLDLFDANKGITLDGVSYRIHIISANIDTVIKVSNPVTSHWRRWEAEIQNLASTLVANSDSGKLTRLFT